MIRFNTVKKSLRPVKTLYQIITFRDIANSQINAIKNRPDSPFRVICRPGYMRGIDFYNDKDLIRILSLLIAKYRKTHGVLPDLTNPQGFNEKILWTKFFTEIKIPESGNKILTSTYIPGDLQGLVCCPSIRWHSSKPILPRNHEIEPGAYYIKANHGASMFKRVEYPLNKNTRKYLEKECTKWLNTSYGIKDAEWWYNVFNKEIIIENDVVKQKRSISYGLFTFKGSVEHIIMHKKGDKEKGELDELTRFDADFIPLPSSQQSSLQPIRNFNLSDDVKTRMKICAARIGSNFSFVRVDFVLGNDGNIYLIELTLSPGNGLAKRPPELDSWLGEKWII